MAGAVGSVGAVALAVLVGASLLAAKRSGRLTWLRVGRRLARETADPGGREGGASEGEDPPAPGPGGETRAAASPHDSGSDRAGGGP